MNTLDTIKVLLVPVAFESRVKDEWTALFKESVLSESSQSPSTAIFAYSPGC